MFDSEQHHPHVGQPAVDAVFAGGVDHIQDHLLHLGPELPRLLDGRPVVVALIEVVPVHLVHSHGKHLLVFGIDAGFDGAVVEQFVDVEGGGVSEVEDEGVAQGLGAHVVGGVRLQQVEQFLVDGVGLEEVVPDGLAEGGVVLDEDGLAAE